MAYKFKPTPGFEIKNLTEEEFQTIDHIIEKFGDLNSNEIVELMHEEEAYKCTDINCIILFSFAEKLNID